MFKLKSCKLFFYKKSHKEMIRFFLVSTSTFIALFSFTSNASKKKQDLSVEKQLQLNANDENENDIKALKTEIMISKTEKKAIDQALKLIKKYKNSPLEPDLHFRLAEMYMRRAKTARFFEINRESETIIRLAPKIVAQANSRQFIVNALSSYQTIQKKFPRYHQMDLVLFNDAFARQQLGQEKEAERIYWLLIQKFHSSPLVPDCHLAIGEINFDRGNFSFALEHFQAIQKYPESRVYPYGHYKAAWSLYNLRRAIDGLKKLEEVVAYGKYVADNKIEARLDLRKEALSDMTVFYEDVLEAKAAFKYFKKQSGELDVAPTLLKLSHLYGRHSKYIEREIVLKDMAINLPNSPFMVEVLSGLAYNYDSLKKKDLALNQLSIFFDLCKSNSRWSQSQVENAIEAVKSCKSTLNETTLKIAYRWLAIWKKQNQYVDYAESAEKAFAIYFREPDLNSEGTQARYAYAELLFKRQKFRLASSEYEKVSLNKEVPDLKHDSSYAAVFSFQKSIAEKWSDSDEKKFKELAKNYLTAYPKGLYQLDIEFKVALIAYEKGKYEEAAPIFFRLGSDHPKSDQGHKSQDLFLDILNIQKKFTELKTYASKLEKLENDLPRKIKLHKIYEQAFFLEIQTLEEQKKWPEAVHGYLSFASINPKSDLAEKAWWNALQIQFKQFDFINGAKTAEEFFDRFPKSPRRLDALLKAAQSYESMAQLVPAANVLLKLALVDPKNASKWNPLAVDFFILGNQPLKAKQFLFEQKKSSDLKIQAQALDKLIVLERSHPSGLINEYLQGLVKLDIAPYSSLARAELLESKFKQGQYTEAFNDAKKVLGNKEASTEAKSRARLIQARILEEEFLKQSIKSSAEKITLVLAIKTEKLEKVQQAYLQVIKYGEGAPSVEASQRLSSCYLHYIEALRGMKLPEGIDTKEANEFRQELSKLSIPIEEKAIETINEGLKLAQKLNHKGPEVAKMKKDLAQLNMPLPVESQISASEPGIMLPVIKGDS